MAEKKLILVVGGRQAQRITRLNSEVLKSKYELILVTDKKKNNKISEETEEHFSQVIYCNFSSVPSVSKALNRYCDKVVAAFTFGEPNINLLRKVVPHVPYINVPTSESLRWATNKVLMRQRFEEYDASISPAFYIAEDYDDKVIKQIEKKMAYPVVVKPVNMATSLFVTKCYHREELELALSKIFKRTGILNQIKHSMHLTEPDNAKVIVEEYMEGKMYSIDGLVDAQGNITQYPLVHVKTGKEIGFDDFFGYQRITPVKVNETRQEEAHEVVNKAIRALKLKNTPFHCEVMRLEEEWKIIEIAPRQGGYRESMYRYAYDIDITHNEFLMKTGQNIPETPSAKGYCAVLQIFAETEGVIAATSGVKKTEELDSVVTVKQKLKKGDRAKFAKNGGKSVFDITLFNKDRSLLLADIRRIEKDLEIKIG